MGNIPNLDTDEKKSKIRVKRTWRNNNMSRTMLFSIPHEMAKDYQLDEPTNILVIPTDQGILIRRLYAGGSFDE